MGEEKEAVLSSWQIIFWWEWRRLLYNFLLLIIGFISIIGFEILMSKVIPLGEDAQEPMGMFLGVAAYAIMANVCYTFGWMVELGTRKVDPVLARKRGGRNVSGRPNILMHPDYGPILVCVFLLLN